MNAKRGQRIASRVRQSLKAIFLYACGVYLLELIRQTPQLTGASRALMVQRFDEVVLLLTKYHKDAARKLRETQIQMEAKLWPVGEPYTQKKLVSGAYPEYGTWSESRKGWFEKASAEGQGPGSLPPGYLPMIVNIGPANAVMGSLQFNVSIENDWYLADWNESWNLLESAQKAYNLTIETLFNKRPIEQVFDTEYPEIAQTLAESSSDMFATSGAELPF